MSVGPMGGVNAAAAGAQLAQTTGSDVQRAGQDSKSQQRQVQADKTADDAAGVGQTNEDSETSERDADGRRIWEVDEQQKQEELQAAQERANRQSKDTSGLSGNGLDLSG